MYTSAACLRLGFTSEASRHLESSYVTAGCTNKKLLMKRARSRAHKKRKKKNVYFHVLVKATPQCHRCWTCAPGSIFRRFVLASIKLYIIGLVLVREAAVDIPTLTIQRVYVWHVALLHISKAHKDNTRRIQFLIVYRTYKTTAS